ncbi:MAG: T9SS type A sorting domain-containing protein [Saprospiraceae bacterium]
MKHLFTTFLNTCFFLQLCFAQSAPGGFAEQWANYPSDAFGTKTITLDQSGLRSIERTAATGVHPRIYFNQSEIPAIKSRLENSQSGQQVMATIHAFTTLLHLGYTAGGYSHNAAYAKDPDGNRRIDNAGYWNSKAIYDKLIAEDPTAFDGADVKRRALLASVMALEAFECLLNAGETDADTGLDYDDRAANLAKAMAYWAQLVDGDADLNWNNYNFFGGPFMAVAYDMNYNVMTTAQQDAVRAGLAEIIPLAPRYGGVIAPYATTSNWCGLNTFELITNLAIEGETGYNADLTKDYMRGWRNFLTYGWYESGTPYEGMGKNYQFVAHMIVMAKRGYSLLGHPHVRAYGQNFLPAITQPYGHAFIGTDVWGGTGWDVTTGGYKFHSNDIVGLKYILPNDQKIDFIWRNYIEQFYKLNSTGYVYQQIVPTSNTYHNNLLVAAIFAEDYQTGDWETQNETALGDLSFFAPERGLAVMRSGYETDDLLLHFHCRQDLGGHTHGDRNGFAMSALGRIWFRYTYGSSFQETEYHSCLLINDLGIKITNLEGRKARQPGIVLDFQDDSKSTKIVGDATYAYSWKWHWQRRPATQDHSWLGTDNWTKVTENWNDFRHTAGAESHHEIPFYDYANWNASPDQLERVIKRPYNPMQRVYRTTTLVKNDKPYVLIVDDVQKDSDVHNYKWLGQIASDLVVDSYDVNLQDADYRSDVILKEPTGDRRLLVRILQNDGYNGTGNPAALINVEPGINGNNPVPRLVIEADVVAPNFKVMLFPFLAGEPLPRTDWNANRDELTVILGSQTDQVTFNENNGRTEVNVSEPVVLAIDYQRFSVSEQQDWIQLEWQISPATSLESFEIERSIDGNNFTKIGSLQSQFSKSHYQFFDKKVQRGQRYFYRLRHQYADGNTDFTTIQTAMLATERNQIRAMPIPFQTTLVIALDDSNEKNATVAIRNTQGQIIYQNSGVNLVGNHDLTISTESFGNGIYWLEIRTATQTYFRKIVKQ